MEQNEVTSNSKALLETTLQSYDDFELAFISRFKQEPYSDKVLAMINDELASRGLTTQRLDELVNEKLSVEIKDHETKICPRCMSTRIMTSKEEFHGNNQAFGLDSDQPLTFIEYKICSICGWNFSVDETSYERSKRIRVAVLSLIMSVLLALLFTYLFFYLGF